MPLIATYGYLENTNLAVITSSGMLGIPSVKISYQWDFGDGTTSNKSNPDPKTYSVPGYYDLTLTVLVDTGFGIELVTETKTIKVLDKFLPLLGSGFEDSKKALAYGNDSTQGWQWSTEGGEGYIWNDTQASQIAFFDANSDWTSLIFDSIDGLPYCVNPHEAYEGSNIQESWSDKFDSLMDTFIEIKSIVRLAEMRGSEENCLCKLSDINLFYNPYKKGQEYRDAFNIDLNIFKDFELAAVARADDIPKDRELYFKGRNIEANLFNLELVMETSYYRLRNCNVKLISYNKARFPFKNDHWEATPQDKFANVELWVSRVNQEGSILERAQGNMIELATGSSVSEPSPDKKNGAFYIQSETDLGDLSDLDNNIITYWTTNETFNLFYFTNSSGSIIDYTGSSITNETIKVVEVEGETWYFRKAWIPAGETVANNFTIPATGSGTKLFDFRLLSTPDLTDEDLDYYYNDIVNDSGNIFCPLTV